jgi:hypothetical protein
LAKSSVTNCADTLKALLWRLIYTDIIVYPDDFACKLVSDTESVSDELRVMWIKLSHIHAASNAKRTKSANLSYSHDFAQAGYELVAADNDIFMRFWICP